eukprot:2977712-Rhodomonas_salina.2
MHGFQRLRLPQAAVDARARCSVQRKQAEMLPDLFPDDARAQESRRCNGQVPAFRTRSQTIQTQQTAKLNGESNDRQTFPTHFISHTEPRVSFAVPDT